MADVSKFKARRRKDLPPPTKGRLISCVVVLAGILILFFMLFAAVLQR